MVSAAGIIAKLPQLPLHRMAESWLNAVRRLSDEDLPSLDREEAERLIAAMHQEWSRRRLRPLAGDNIEDWPVNDDLRRREVQGPQKHTPLTAHGYHVGRRFRPPRPSSTRTSRAMRGRTAHAGLQRHSPTDLGGASN